MGRLFLVLSLLLISSCGSELPIYDPLSIEDREMLDRVNAARAEARMCGEESMPAVGPLTWNELLTNSSHDHAKDMRDNDYFSHQSLDGSELSDRVLRAGYEYRVCGENIAAGHTSIAQVVQAWIDSPGHCKNLMYEGFTELGAARVGNHWVQNFGAPR